MGELIEFHNWDPEIEASNLVTNGNQELEDNTNFPNFTYVADEGGYFSASGNFQVLFSSELIPVNKYDLYKASAEIRDDGSSADNRCYLGVICYDINKLEIGSDQVKIYTNTFTTLTQDLNDGDTQIKVADTTNWQVAGSQAHQRRIGFWGAENTPYPEGTMTPDVFYYYNDIVDSTTISLNSSWTRGFYPSGTVVANHYSGGTYMYTVTSNVLLTNDWAYYEDIGGQQGWGLNDTYSAFRYGTYYIRFLMLLNRGSGTNTSHVRNIKIWNATTGDINFDYGNSGNTFGFNAKGQAKFLEANEVGPTRGLYAWYKADGTVKDDLSNHDDLTLVNSPSYDSGVDGQGYRLDGTTSYVRTPNFNLDAYQSWTISFWVYRESPLTNEAILMGAGYSIRLFSSTYTFIQNDGTYRSGSYTAGTLNDWTHFAVVFDHINYGAYIYRNGVLDTQQTAVDGTNRPITTLYFGYATGGNITYYYLNGKVDDMRLYREALTPQEVWNLYVTYGQANQKVSLSSENKIYISGQAKEA